MYQGSSFAMRFSITFALLWVALAAASALDHDHDKSKAAQAPQPAPAPRGNSGAIPPRGNPGRPSTGRPAGNPNMGKPGGMNNAGQPTNAGTPGHPANSSAAGASGRPSYSSGSGRPMAVGRPAGNAGNGMKGGNNAGSIGKVNTPMAGRGESYESRSKAGGGEHPGREGKGYERGGPSHDHDVRTNGPSMRHEPVRVVHEEHGRSVARDDRGRIRDIRGHDSHGHEIAIHRDYRGRAHFETRRPGGYRVVGYGHGRGFAERRYIARGGRVYYQRTYIYGGRRYAVAYRYYPYHGVYYYRYAPAYYYHPAFYGWVYRPWPGPVVYHWGWYGDPWYGYYGPYFAPYPTYPTASLWLTDFLLAENLRAAYEANVAAAQANAAAAQANANAAVASQTTVAPSSGGQVALSPEVKQMIADEVKRQLDQERAAAAQPQQSGGAAQDAANSAEQMPDALDPNQRVFIVASNLDLASDAGECTVTAGDVLMRMSNDVDQNNKVPVNVVSSKQGDCPVNTDSGVEAAELQEMHNHFREKLDAGLKNLAENQGKNGLPQAPDTGTTAGEVPPPQVDNTAEGDLQNQQKDADQAEQDTQKGSPGGGGGQGGK